MNYIHPGLSSLLQASEGIFTAVQAPCCYIPSILKLEVLTLH